MKIRKTIPFLSALVLVGSLAAPAALGADLADVGYVDQAAIGALGPFQAANGQVARYKAQLDSQFARQIKRARSDADRRRIAGDFQQRFLNEQRTVLGPLFGRAQAAIAQVSSSQHLSVIVDKRIVVYGGVDITKNVVDLVNGPGAVVPPSATPPPSDVGYVDQTQIDQVPKIKQANDAFLKYAGDQRAQALAQMQGAKSNPQQQQTIFQNYQKNLSAQQDKMLKPLVDQTRSAMAKVAQQKHLILVVDRSDVIYGGMDITQDVQNALK